MGKADVQRLGVSAQPKQLWCMTFGGCGDIVEIAEEWCQFEFVDARSVTNAHQASHEVEEPAAHVGAAAAEKDL